MQTITAPPEAIAEAKRECRWRKDGLPARGVPPLTRIFARCTASPEGCWEWQGAVNPKGYASVHHGGRMRRAHRVVWEELHGPIGTVDVFVCHRCDNPRCCNPEHLFLGTATDNNRDRHAKGRTVVPDPGDSRGIRKREQTHCIHGHEFTPENTHIRSNGSRACRTCRQLRDAGRARNGTRRVTSGLLEQMAFDSGKEITLRAHHAELALGQHLFVAPLASAVTIPAQRTPGEES